MDVSADVLFGFDEATLTAKAGAALDEPIEFEVAGKGEANPVAPNRKNGQDNPEGNRRVEISYERTARQQPDEPTQPADTPSATATANLANLSPARRRTPGDCASRSPDCSGSRTPRS